MLSSSFPGCFVGFLALFPYSQLTSAGATWDHFYPVPVNDPSVVIPSKTQIPIDYVPTSEPDHGSISIDNQIQCDGPPTEINITPLIPRHAYTSIRSELIWGTQFLELSARTWGTLRQLCAKPKYGGLEAFNLGMWCDPQQNEVRSEYFMRPRGPHAALSALFLQCHLRCRCVARDQRDGLPASVVVQSEALLANVNEENDFEPFANPGRWKNTKSSGMLFELDYQREPNGGIGYLLMAPNPRHRAPRCAGKMPGWRLPDPFMREGVKPLNVQELCAATWFGGNKLGNAGAVCQDENTWRLKFLDYLAHPSLESSDFPSGLMIVLWCQSVCKCIKEQVVGVQTQTISYVRDSLLYTVNFPRGSIAMTITGPFGSQTITPETTQGAATSLDILGLVGSQRHPGMPRPGDQGTCSLAEASTSRQQACQTCSQRCTANAECSNRGGRGCKCVATPRRKTPTRWLGSCALDALKGFRGAPGGRKRNVDVIQCACNATYVSRSCCESDDGLVWEAGRSTMNIVL